MLFRVISFQNDLSSFFIVGTSEQKHHDDGSEPTVPAPPKEQPVPPNPPEPTTPHVKVSVANSQSEQTFTSAVVDTASQNLATSAVDSIAQNTPAAVVDPMMQNAQMQYSAANYMYSQHMTDPSMMSNYPYMASNYSDYMSMYNPMQQQQYANTYATYQNYSYAYPAMQQMYDGRNMTQYASNYPAQMLPATPPLPGAQVVNNYNPPLPTEKSIASTLPKVPVSHLVNVDSQPPLQVKKDETEKKGSGNTDKSVVDDAEPTDAETNVETDLKEGEIDKELEKTTDDPVDVAQTNPVSEDVNR